MNIAVNTFPHASIDDSVKQNYIEQGFPVVVLQKKYTLDEFKEEQNNFHIYFNGGEGFLIEAYKNSSVFQRFKQKIPEFSRPMKKRNLYNPSDNLPFKALHLLHNAMSESVHWYDVGVLNNGVLDHEFLRK